MSNQWLNIEVLIGETVKKIKDIYKAIENEKEGYIMFNGKLIQHPNDTSFEKLQAKSNSVFIMAVGEG